MVCVWGGGGAGGSHAHLDVAPVRVQRAVSIKGDELEALSGCMHLRGRGGGGERVRVGGLSVARAGCRAIRSSSRAATVQEQQRQRGARVPGQC